MKEAYGFKQRSYDFSMAAVREKLTVEEFNHLSLSQRMELYKEYRSTYDKLNEQSKDKQRDYMKSCGRERNTKQYKPYSFR